MYFSSLLSLLHKCTNWLRSAIAGSYLGFSCPYTQNRRVCAETVKQCVTVSSRNCWQPLSFIEQVGSDANNEAAASLSVCLPGPDSHWCTNYYSSYSDTLRWQTGTWLCQHTLTQPGRILWRGLDDSWWSFDSDYSAVPPMQNAESTETHSPQNNITEAGGRFWMLRTAGHLSLFLFAI